VLVERAASWSWAVPHPCLWSTLSLAVSTTSGVAPRVVSACACRCAGLPRRAHRPRRRRLPRDSPRSAAAVPEVPPAVTATPATVTTQLRRATNESLAVR
jgi:hypothetical protein